MEVITDLLHRAVHTEDATASRELVQRAYDVASGLDEYLETVSSPPSEVGLSATSCYRSEALWRCPAVLR